MTSNRVEPRPLDRDLSQVATEIVNDYGNKESFYAAMPYAFAMLACHTRDLGAYYYDDQLDEMVIRLLGNLHQWRGQVARRVKEELRAALADYQQQRKKEH